jgi:hypothetical protein
VSIEGDTSVCGSGGVTMAMGVAVAGWQWQWQCGSVAVWQWGCVAVWQCGGVVGEKMKRIG